MSSTNEDKKAVTVGHWRFKHAGIGWMKGLSMNPMAGRICFGLMLGVDDFISFGELQRQELLCRLICLRVVADVAPGSLPVAGSMMVREPVFWVLLAARKLLSPSCGRLLRIWL